MNVVGSVQSIVLLILGLGALVLTGVALVDVLRRRGPLFPHAGRLSKGAWLGILIAAFLISIASFFSPLGLLNIAGVIAAAVYLVDVKPKLQQLGGGGSTNDGPYGKW
jgi:hypothetical protein